MGDWQLGDLALCVVQSGWVLACTGADAEGPRCGSIYVVRVMKVTARHGLFLVFAEWPGRGFHHRGFVKVTPDEELIAEERKAGVPA